MNPLAFSNLPLRRRLLLLVGIAAVVSLLLAVAAAAIYDFSTYRPRAVAQARAQVQSIAAIVTAAVEFQDASTANQYLGALGRDPTIEALAIVLEDGTVFAEYHRPGMQRVDLADAPTRQRLMRAGRILITYTIDSQGPVDAHLW